MILGARMDLVSGKWLSPTKLQKDWLSIANLLFWHVKKNKPCRILYQLFHQAWIYYISSSVPCNYCLKCSLSTDLEHRDTMTLRPSCRTLLVTTVLKGCCQIYRHEFLVTLQVITSKLQKWCTETALVSSILQCEYSGYNSGNMTLNTKDITNAVLA